MKYKEGNEITVRVTCDKEHLIKCLNKLDFKETDSFNLNDYYYIPKDIDIVNTSTREILSKAVIVRNFTGKVKNKTITFKIKDINDEGEILDQKFVNCSVSDIEEARSILESIGYKKIMNIKEDNVNYIKDNFKLTVKYIEDRYILIESEIDEKYNTIRKIKNMIDKLNLPIVKNQYFVKKAEIELNGKLDRN